MIKIINKIRIEILMKLDKAHHSLMNKEQIVIWKRYHLNKAIKIVIMIHTKKNLLNFYRELNLKMKGINTISLELKHI